MCDVCVATIVLETGINHKTVDGKIINIRAKGEGAENKPCEFQLKYSDQEWTDVWHKTNDLAGTMSDLMLDVHDELATEEVREKRNNFLN